MPFDKIPCAKTFESKETRMRGRLQTAVAQRSALALLRVYPLTSANDLPHSDQLLRLFLDSALMRAPLGLLSVLLAVVALADAGLLYWRVVHSLRDPQAQGAPYTLNVRITTHPPRPLLPDNYQR